MEEEISGGVLPTLNSTLLKITSDEVDTETCQLLGPFALVIQGLMGAIVLFSLLIKRAQEKPRRKWKTWMADISKQVLGQLFVHASNVFISATLAQHSDDNPCSLYALNIAVDTTLGVLILYYFLKFSTARLQQYEPDSFTTGDYGTPFNIGIWAKQAALYVVCLSGMKLVVVALFWLIPWFMTAANWCLSWLPGEDAQVFFVMLIFPLVMNTLQFLLIDSFLKYSETPSSSKVPDDEEARQAFLSRHSDFEDDDPDSPFVAPPLGKAPNEVYKPDDNSQESDDYEPKPIPSIQTQRFSPKQTMRGSYPPTETSFPRSKPKPQRISVVIKSPTAPKTTKLDEHSLPIGALEVEVEQRRRLMGTPMHHASKDSMNSIGDGWGLEEKEEVFQVEASTPPNKLKPVDVV